MINTVNQYSISQLLDSDSNALYQIPKYQREYTWAFHQWEDLFDDVTENARGYFLGSIICINVSADPIGEKKFEVVDGQQRLTTLSIVLAALYSALQERRQDMDDEQLADLLQLKRKLVIKNQNDKTRVVPQVQNNNLADYRALFGQLKLISFQTIPKFAGNRRMFRAYNYFKKRIETELADTHEPVTWLFDTLDKLNSAILVMIEVSNHADAYTLFESLNNRGTPLTAVDLIKNLLLAKLDAAASSEIDSYFEKWTQLLTYLGEDYSVQERFFRHNYNAFRKSINEPFKKDDRLYPLGPIATRTTLLSIYERVISRDPQAFMEEILENADIYAGFLLREQQSMDETLRESYLDLERIQGTPSYLLLLFLLKRRDTLALSDAHIVKLCKLLISFFVRRNLTDIPATRDLTRIFMGLVEDIEVKGLTGGTILDVVSNRLIDSSASDELFKERLNGPVYDDNAGATRFILCSIARQGMTVENKVDLWKYNGAKQYVWTIEHIFPQGENIPTSWVDMISNGDKELAKDYQSRYVHTFGNLTITGYNSTLGNRSFQEKRDRRDSNGKYVGYRNGLNLNDDVVCEDKWTTDTIQSRTEKLVTRIMDMFRM